MASKDHPDPIADWFRRHRVKLAVIVFVVIMAGRVPRLLEGTSGVIAFDYAAAFFGLLSWSWASRQDRTDARYYLKFGTLWTLLLAIQIGMVVVALARGGTFQGRWLVPMVFVGLFALFSWIPYLRIKGGKPWPPQPTGAQPEAD